MPKADPDHKGTRLAPPQKLTKMPDKPVALAQPQKITRQDHANASRHKRGGTE